MSPVTCPHLGPWILSCSFLGLRHARISISIRKVKEKEGSRDVLLLTAFYGSMPRRVIASHCHCAAVVSTQTAQSDKLDIEISLIA